MLDLWIHVSSLNDFYVEILAQVIGDIGSD